MTENAPLKVDPTIEFLTLDGEKFRKTDKPDGPVATLGWVIGKALTDAPADDKGGDTKFERFMLGMEFAKATLPVEVTPEQLTDIRACVDKMFGTMIVGQAWPHLYGPKKK